MADIERKNGSTNYEKIIESLKLDPRVGELGELTGIWEDDIRKGRSYLVSEFHVVPKGSIRDTAGLNTLAASLLGDVENVFRHEAGAKLDADGKIVPGRLRSFDQLSPKDFRVIQVIINPAP